MNAKMHKMKQNVRDVRMTFSYYVILELNFRDFPSLESRTYPDILNVCFLRLFRHILRPLLVAGQSPHELLALSGPATIHWMVAAYSSMSCEAVSKSDKKCIKNQTYKSTGIGSYDKRLPL